MLIYPDRGFLYHIDIGLSIDLYKNPTGFINSFQVFGGIWNEFWIDAAGRAAISGRSATGGSASRSASPSTGASASRTCSSSCPADRRPTTTPSASAINDSHLGFPVTFNPFVNVFYNAAGFTNIPTGSNTYRVEIGVRPTSRLRSGSDIPLTVAFPTWVTVAPKSYYNRE